MHVSGRQGEGVERREGERSEPSRSVTPSPGTVFAPIQFFPSSRRDDLRPEPLA